MAQSTVTRPGAAPGESADKPQEIPKRGWLQIAKRGWAEAKTDNVPLLAAGVAFYTFLAIFPAMIALVLVYGLVADPAQISSQIDQLGSAVPAAAKSLIEDNLQTLSARPAASGVSLAIAILLALWSASGGMNNMMKAVNLAYDEEPKRSFVKQRGLALLLTVGAIVVMVVMLGLVAVAPGLLKIATFGFLKIVLQILRWIVLVAVVTAALAVLYRVAPDRDAPKLRWVSVGAAVATVIWVVASVGFSVYASFGGYAKTYGALAGIVVLLFWLWITCYAILLGAEINAESEQQTVKDTTKGPEAPIGSRGAVKADSIPDDADPSAATDHTSIPTPQEKTMDDTVHTKTDALESSSPDPHRSEPNRSDPHRSDPNRSDSNRSDSNRSDSNRSVGELVKSVSEDLTSLVRSEIRLATTEVTEKAKGLGIGVGAFGAAGVLALFGFGLLLATAVIALSLVLPAWLAALIVTVVVFAGAGVAALVGKKKVSEAAPPVPTKAIESVKEDVAEIKETIKR